MVLYVCILQASAVDLLYARQSAGRGHDEILNESENKRAPN